MKKYWRVLEELLLAMRSKDLRFDVVEVGVSHGRLSEILLRKFPELHLWMVDPWDTSKTQRYELAAHGDAPRTRKQMRAMYEKSVRRTERFANRRTILRCTSAEAAPQVQDHSKDLVFLDADHTYDGVREDLVLWARKVRPMGILAGHDWGCENTEVESAVTDWANQVVITSIHLEVSSVWWMRM